ncbi:hypothetical protein [Amaricoccus solimangrovi]|uniref:Uncharacterized protein n=1 Tax=Amaricoccus solimangrovi TaxID=2589815 RepID=A0A501WJN5_9RHOB|nr:hypothetical protein [Amaricoccus solimangrovi]TPE47241.1 hypothetical protein FJM51_20520 [Amaricoccus solimangrovi]
MSAAERSPGLLMVAGEDELPVYPLHTECRLGGLDYFPFHHARFFGSTMFATATNEEIGASLALWTYALGTQAPGGTLPTADVELAHAARCWRDMASWERLRTGVLRGWTRVRVLDQDGAPAGVRLAHPVVTEVAADMWKLVERARGKRQGNLDRQRLGRLRATLSELGFQQIARDEDKVLRVRAWLAERALPQSKPDVRAAVQRIFGMIT